MKFENGRPTYEERVEMRWEVLLALLASCARDGRTALEKVDNSYIHDVVETADRVVSEFVRYSWS